MRVDKYAIKRLINGEGTPEDIYNVFNWESTPQCFTFWYNERKNLYNGESLSHEALMYLTYLLLDHENVITETNSTIDLAT